MEKVLNTQQTLNKVYQLLCKQAKEINSSSNDMQGYKTELEALRRNHELMKEGNKRIAQAKKKGEDISKYLIDTFGIAAHIIDWTMQFGFGLQNNNANIKRVEERIKELEAKEKMLENSPLTKYSFEGGEFHINYEIDRIQIFFNNRPTSEELRQWKDKGLSSFNWSPSAKAWQRKITPNAIGGLKRMFDKITKL